MSERQSPLEFMKNSAEADRSNESIKKTQDITKILVKNRGILGGGIDGEKSHVVCEEIFTVLAMKKNVTEIESMADDKGKFDTSRAMANDNLAILGRAVSRAINFSFTEYDPDNLMTSHLTAEEIDRLLSKTPLKGIGKHVVAADSELTEEDKGMILDTNKKVTEVVKNNSLEAFYATIESMKDKPSDSLERQYKEVAISFLGSALGISDRGHKHDGVMDQNMEAMRIEQELKKKLAGEGAEENGKSSFFMMSREQVIDEEMQQRGKQQFHFNPPYPEWFDRLSRKEQELHRIRCKLINGVAWKQMIRNKDVDKLMANEAIDINRSELKLLYEMPHFKDALKTFFTEFFEPLSEEGANLLRLKRENGPDKVRGTLLLAEMEDKLVHFQIYKEKMALRFQFTEKSKQEIDVLYNDEAWFKKNKASEEGMACRSGVAAAWDFLYIGNTLESADVDRQFKPCEIISDKLRSMIHPLQKAMGKWGVYKEGENDDEEYTDVTGKEEPMGGPIAAWVKYHLEMDKVRGLDPNSPESFRYKLRHPTPGYRPLPGRMATSLVEMLMVNYQEGPKDHKRLVMDEKKPGKPKKIPMSQAILESKDITFDVVKVREKNKDGKLVYVLKTKDQALADLAAYDSVVAYDEVSEPESEKRKRERPEIISHEYEGHDYDICVGFRDTMDGCKTAFDFLTGKAKLDLKSKKEWLAAYTKDIPLIVQNETKYYKDKDGKLIWKHLQFVKNPEFLAWVLASSTGFDHRSERLVLNYGPIGCNGNNYFYCIEGLVNLPGFAMLETDKSEIMSYLSAESGPWITTTQVNYLSRKANNNERERTRYSQIHSINSDEW